jgi:hypothetical protein
MLQVGIPTSVINALPAGITGVTGQAAASVVQFTVQPRPNAEDRNSAFTAVPNGNVTTLTVDLEVSSDGGTSWQKRTTGIALIASSTSTESVQANLQPGLLYRLNATTNTGGTNVTVNATVA